MPHPEPIRPDAIYPDTMRPLAASLDAAVGGSGQLSAPAITKAVGHTYREGPAAWAAEFKRRGMALQAAGNLRTGGSYRPDPEPERLSPSATRQLRWMGVLGAREQ